MKKKSHRHFPLESVTPLECRTLLTAALPTATWLGQDGVDLAGRSSTLGGEGVQDIDIEVTGLPTNLSITQAIIEGYGSGEWEYNGPPNGPWAAALVQAPGASTADFYIMPYQVETGRPFFITLTYSDGSTASISLMGGTANPGLWMPGLGMNLQWMGQDGRDWTGPTAAVGPDGYQDADISLTQLQSTWSVASASLTASGGGQWAFGTNPDLLPTAVLVQDPSNLSEGDLYFDPLTNLNGQTLTLTIEYTNGIIDTTTVVAGATNPDLPMPPPTPVAVTENAFSVTWLGQDGQDLLGPGDVHLALSGIPAGTGTTVVAAQLTDGTLTSWDYTTPGASLQDGNEIPQPLAFQLDPTDPTQASVDFPPVRDESQATMTLRLVLSDGTNLISTFAGGPVNLAELAPEPAATSVLAAPGDDLQTLANEYGTVHLTAGTYDLSAPLVLSAPVTITADPGTTLLFTQPAGAPTWTAAIKILAGNTTLSGFAVQFTGPINWTSNINYGPGVISTTDNYDTGPPQVLENITLTGLNLQSPPAASAWEMTPDLIQVTSAQSGVISNNILKGGTTEFIGGPWVITGNTYEGTLPDTYTTAAFAGHWTHDLMLANNVAQPVGPSGKTYRFLVLTQSGVDDVVQNNDVVGIGPMDSDTEPNPNATEVILTEAYYVDYEGVPMTISPDGMVVQISNVLAGVVQAGDVLSVLAGPDAGQWRVIAMELNPTTYLLSSPIDPGTTAISISQGFVDESFVGNTINTTGSSTAADLVLAGNQFGVQVLNNTLIGGDRAFWISAYPSETPSIWGWTHAPVLGAVISGNIIEDSLEGGILDVEHDAESETDIGRVYMTATLTDNTGIFTADFLSEPAVASATSPLYALTVGMATSNYPGELVVSESGNQVEGPASLIANPTMWTVAAVVNGQVVTNTGTVLPAITLTAPTGLALVDDTGAPGNAGQTSDPALQFNPVPLAAGYEYSLTGEAGSFQPVTSPASFLPSGLTDGFNAVFVQAYDAVGDNGPDALIEFAYVPATGDGNTSGSSSTTGTSSAAYEYGISADGPFVPLGTSIILTAAEEAAGPIVIQIETVSAGNSSTPALTASSNTGASTTAGGAPPTSDSTSEAIVPGAPVIAADSTSEAIVPGAPVIAADSTSEAIVPGATDPGAGTATQASGTGASGSVTSTGVDGTGAVVSVPVSIPTSGRSSAGTATGGPASAAMPVPIPAAATVSAGVGVGAPGSAASAAPSAATSGASGAGPWTITTLSLDPNGSAFALTDTRHGAGKGKGEAGGLKSSYGPAWARDPHPFRKAGTKAQTADADHAHPGLAHAHAARVHPARFERRKPIAR